MSTTPQVLTLRQAQSTKELEALFRLRHEGYLESRCASLVDENADGLSFDRYDWNAHHLGLFQEGHFGAHPLGYMRLVEKEQLSDTLHLDQLVNQYGAERPPRSSKELPLMANCPQKDAIGRHLQLLEEEQASVVEAGRFVFAPEARSGGYTRFMLEAALAYLLYRCHYDTVLLACHPRHAPAYYRFGFKQIIDGRDNDYGGLAASILSLQSWHIRKAVQERIELMAPIARHYGAISMRPESKQLIAPFTQLQQAA